MIPKKPEPARYPTTTRPTTAGSRARQLTAVVLVLSALVFLIYGHALRAPFYFDDFERIVENPHIRMTRLSVSQIGHASLDQPPGRSLPFFTFAVDYLFHQDRPEGYRLVNLLIHVACGFLVFLLTRRTLALCGRENTLSIALAAALLWLSHPLHIQSVTYIVQRINSLAALFFLASVWLYIEARGNRPGRPAASFRLAPAVAAGLCALAAFSSKQNTAVLPLVILLYEWIFFQNRDPDRAKKLVPWIFAALPALLLLSLFYLGGSPLNSIARMYDKHFFTMGERLLIQPTVIIYYISLLAFPHPNRLHLDYNFPPDAPFIALIALAALIAAALAVNKNRLVVFALLWFLMTLVVESSFIGLALIYEHRTYLPSVFPIIALTACLFRGGRSQTTAAIVVGLLIAVNGLWTWQRNSVWLDPLGFRQDGIDKTPANDRPYNDYGLALLEAGEFDRAADAFRRAIALARGTEAVPYNNLGRLYFDRGDPDKAGRSFEQAVRADPGFYKAHLNLGVLMILQGHIPEGISRLKEALRLNPRSAAVHVALGKAYFQNDDTAKAVYHSQRARDLDPLDVGAGNNLGAILLAVGDPEKALPVLTEAVRLAPDHPEANLNLGLVHDRLGNTSFALAYLLRAVFLAPDHAGARAELGLFLLRSGRTGAAREYLETALKLNPTLLKARLALAGLLLEDGRFDRAAEHYRIILEIDPDNRTARQQLRFPEPTTGGPHAPEPDIRP